MKPKARKPKAGELKAGELKAGKLKAVKLKAVKHTTMKPKAGKLKTGKLKTGKLKTGKPKVQSSRWTEEDGPLKDPVKSISRNATTRTTDDVAVVDSEADESPDRGDSMEGRGNSSLNTKKLLPVPPAFKPYDSTTTKSQPPANSIADSGGSQQPLPKTHSGTNVVHGFTIPPPSNDALRPESSHTTHSETPARFALGGSCSSNEQDRGLSNNKPMSPIVKNFWFQTGGSSDMDGFLKSAMASSPTSSIRSARKKKASFSNMVITRIIDAEAAVGSDTEDDYIDESAIDDDDDSSDWEDSMEESGKSSMDDKFFQRVDSKPNLTSRQSLITLMLAQNDRARNLGNHASQSTPAITRSCEAHGPPSPSVSPNDSDGSPLMMKGLRGSDLEPIHEVPRSSAQPIMTGPNHIQPQAALSPRTTRRNMLSTELTESLRRHLLWERQQKSSTANAVLKRRHTSHDVANLKQYPEKPCLKQSEDVNASDWNQYFSKKASDGYHSKGW